MPLVSINRYPLLKTLASLKRGNLISILFLSAFISLAVVILGAAGVTWLSTYLIEIERGWLDMAVNFLIGILSGVGAWFLFPVFSVLIAGAFQETVIKRVEAAYYPGSKEREGGFWPDLLHDIRFTVWGVFLNILVLPLYIFSIGFAVSILLNSYLLGREFFESAAGYHLGKDKAQALIKENKMSVYLGGFIITMAALVPLLNLFIPIIAVVWMTHLYHAIGEGK